MRLSRLLPLIAFALLVVLFAFGIYWSAHHDTREVRSPLVGKPAPVFALPLLGDPERRVGSAELAGKPADAVDAVFLDHLSHRKQQSTGFGH